MLYSTELQIRFNKTTKRSSISHHVTMTNKHILLILRAEQVFNSYPISHFKRINASLCLLWSWWLITILKFLQDTQPFRRNCGTIVNFNLGISYILSTHLWRMKTRYKSTYSHYLFNILSKFFNLARYYPYTLLVSAYTICK